MEMKKFLALAMLSFLPRMALAWGPVGHDAIAMIAQKRLTPQAKAALHAILGKDLELYKIANCADALRSATEPFNCGGAFMVEPASATAPWHFIDIPISGDANPSSLMNFCPGGQDCVVGQIQKNLQILRDAGAAQADKRMALLFLVHFVGDEHQPLHCSDDNDQGGNKKPVLYKDNKMTFHSLWDAAMRTPDQSSYKLPPEVLAANAAALDASLESQISGQDASAWGQGDLPVVAALESFVLAKNTVYPSYQYVLGATYQAQMQPLAEQRIKQAGVRLAILLNSALAAHP